MSDDEVKVDEKDKDEVDLPEGEIDPDAVAPIIEPEDDLELPADDLGFGGEDEFGDPLIKPVKKTADEEESVDEAVEEEDGEDEPYDDIDEW